MNPVVQKTAVSLPSKQGVVDADAKALLAPNALVGFYEAALHKVKTSRTAERVIDAEEEDASAVLTETETEAEAQAQVEALLTGVVEAEPTTLLLSATALPASEPAKATGLAFNTDNPLTYILPVLLLGTAMGGSDSAAAATASEDHCDIDFTFPSRPTGATVQTVSLAALETEVQTFGDALVLEEGESLVVELGTLSELSGGTTTAGNSGGTRFLVTASGNVGDLHINVGNSADAQLVVDVSGGVGDISMRTGKDTESGISVIVSAGGDVGNVSRFADGAEAAGHLYIDTTGGDVARVDALYANPEGYGDVRVSAYAAVSGLSLVGGNVGDVSLAIEGPESEGKIYVQTSGGDVGDVEIIACGGSASGQIYVSAFAQIDGNGLAVGGNIGDVTIVAHGGSADPEVYASAYGILSISGQYLGGGNIGNVHISASGGSAEADGYITSHSGGSIGNITLQTSSPAENVYEASASVYATVTGAGGQVATIGDVNITVYGGFDNSGDVTLRAFSGGDIGTITAIAIGGASGNININALAYVNASGSGGNIGDVSLTDTSWAGDNRIDLTADASIGAVSASLGGGSANVRMYVNAGADAVVGNISVAFDDEHYASGGFIYLGMASGATGADISVTGASTSSQFSIWANSYQQSYAYAAEVAGDIDMSTFAGLSVIDLNTVVDGVSIDVGQGGSIVTGSLGADTIALGAGSDQIKFNLDEFNSFTLTDTDTITGFDALADEADAMDSFYIQTWGGGDLVELTADVATALNNNEAVTLVDRAGGQDLSTTAGLLAALNSGEYALVDGEDGDVYTFATANATTATSFNLFHVEHDGGVFTNASLLAEVSMTGSTFADLSTSNFYSF